MFYCILFCLATLCVAEDLDISDNGTMTSNAEGRIAGGKRAHINNYPYQVQIHVPHKLCPGSIINSRYILTTASCIGDASVHETNVLVGNSRARHGVNMPITDVQVHPYYRPHEFDVAVLRTMYPFQFYKRFRPANLAAAESNLPNELVLTGWGTNERISHNEELMEVDVHVVENKRCQSEYPEVRMTNNMFCAENVHHRGKGACTNDEGSPATLRGTGRLVGLNSINKECRHGTAPSIYTNLHANDVYNFIMYATENENNY